MLPKLISYSSSAYSVNLESCWFYVFFTSTEKVCFGTTTTKKSNQNNQQKKQKSFQGIMKWLDLFLYWWEFNSFNISFWSEQLCRTSYHCRSIQNTYIYKNIYITICIYIWGLKRKKYSYNKSLKWGCVSLIFMQPFELDRSQYCAFHTPTKFSASGWQDFLQGRIHR